MRFSVFRSVLTATVLSAALIPAVGHSSTVLGNPTTGIVALGTQTTYIDNMVAKPCTGATQVISVQDVVSSHSSIDLNLGQESWCYLYLNVQWTTGGSVMTVEVGGFDVYQTVTGANDWVIQVDSSAGTATLVADTGKS
ncbi:MAG: hypothetical protein ACJAZO_001101 [Myxococcota bacterium]|jgi:hypothetical protein